MVYRSITALVAGLMMFAATACNTVEGAGKDVSSAGDAVSNAAADSK
jgi:predicted small secreted protein